MKTILIAALILLLACRSTPDREPGDAPRTSFGQAVSTAKGVAAHLEAGDEEVAEQAEELEEE